ncbi:replication-associated recombination protein A [Mycoplasmatota bacterium]|nr:replication-associated recombination protein A [Mycoplasmatota bacterium]
MQPLAYRIRPKKIEEVVGQQHLIGEGKLINNLIENNKMFSLIFFGPPGVGKTTIAKVLAEALNIPYAEFNAATDNKERLKQLIKTAQLSTDYIIIIDEIHRLKKDIQDLLLPYLEDGTTNLIGLTTNNPYFSVNPAIRSRCHLLELKPLSNDDIKYKLIEITKSEEIIKNKSIHDEAINSIIEMANGDLRSAINLLELTVLSSKDKEIKKEQVNLLHSQTSFTIDKNSDGHYDTLSAFQKSIRGSDVNAALHYLARLIVANDLESICRRLAIISFEDIGLANPLASIHTMSAIEAARQVGLPEARLPLSNAVIELALSPKSMSGHEAIDLAIADIKKGVIGDIPEFIKYRPINPPFKYSAKDPNKYKYQYLPDNLKDIEYYRPKENPNTYEFNLIQNYKLLKSKKIKG